MGKGPPFDDKPEASATPSGNTEEVLQSILDAGLEILGRELLMTDEIKTNPLDLRHHMERLLAQTFFSIGSFPRPEASDTAAWTIRDMLLEDPRSRPHLRKLIVEHHFFDQRVVFERYWNKTWIASVLTTSDKQMIFQRACALDVTIAQQIIETDPSIVESLPSALTCMNRLCRHWNDAGYPVLKRCFDSLPAKGKTAEIIKDSDWFACMEKALASDSIQCFTAVLSRLAPSPPTAVLEHKEDRSTPSSSTETKRTGEAPAQTFAEMKDVHLLARIMDGRKREFFDTYLSSYNPMDTPGKRAALFGMLHFRSSRLDDSVDAYMYGRVFQPCNRPVLTTQDCQSILKLACQNDNQHLVRFLLTEFHVDPSFEDQCLLRARLEPKHTVLTMLLQHPLIRPEANHQSFLNDVCHYWPDPAESLAFLLDDPRIDFPDDDDKGPSPLDRTTNTSAEGTATTTGSSRMWQKAVRWACYNRYFDTLSVLLYHPKCLSRSFLDIQIPWDRAQAHSWITLLDALYLDRRDLDVLCRLMDRHPQSPRLFASRLGSPLELYAQWLQQACKKAHVPAVQRLLAYQHRVLLKSPTSDFAREPSLVDPRQDLGSFLSSRNTTAFCTASKRDAQEVVRLFLQQQALIPFRPLACCQDTNLTSRAVYESKQIMTTLLSATSSASSVAFATVPRFRAHFETSALLFYLSSPDLRERASRLSLESKTNSDDSSIPSKASGYTHCVGAAYRYRNILQQQWVEHDLPLDVLNYIVMDYVCAFPFS